MSAFKMTDEKYERYLEILNDLDWWLRRDLGDNKFEKYQLETVFEKLQEITEMVEEEVELKTAIEIESEKRRANVKF